MTTNKTTNSWTTPPTIKTQPNKPSTNNRNHNSNTHSKTANIKVQLTHNIENSSPSLTDTLLLRSGAVQRSELFRFLTRTTYVHSHTITKCKSHNIVP